MHCFSQSYVVLDAPLDVVKFIQSRDHKPVCSTRDKQSASVEIQALVHVSIRLIAITVLSLRVKLGSWQVLCLIFCAGLQLSTGLTAVHHRVTQIHITDIIMILMLNMVVPQSYYWPCVSGCMHSVLSGAVASCLAF